MRSSHHNDLLVIGRIGEGLLIATHTCRKDCLAESLTNGAPRFSSEDTSIIKDQEGVEAHLMTVPSRITQVPLYRTSCT